MAKATSSLILSSTTQNSLKNKQVSSLLITRAQAKENYRIYCKMDNVKEIYFANLEFSAECTLQFLLSEVLNQMPNKHLYEDCQIYLARKNGEPKLDLPAFALTQLVGRTGQTSFSIILCQKQQEINLITSPRYRNSISEVVPNKLNDDHIVIKPWNWILCCEC